ncbi:MAG: LuxR C-terminal-related transcriptional regulator [Anaerolineales bacterium]|jgi:LuxR family maltose regulon positive regulatory protein
MDDSLLVTKLQIPRQPPYAIQRAGLVDALEVGIPQYKLILLSAPAGYGKTTQLAQWARASSSFPLAWLSVDEEDNDLLRFLRYLLAGWEQVQPDISERPLGLLLNARSPETSAVLSAFINSASESPDQITFVLDDYHLIEDESIHQALSFLLDHAPPNLHFVLAVRGEPPLPLARYRAHGEMLEFRAEELRFSPEETVDFLVDGMGLDLASEELESFQSQLEGWIVGLQLIALAKRQGSGRTDKRSISGSQRFIADYLREDVLDQLPFDTQEFLLQTSILDRMCADLCDAVTGQNGGQKMLEALEEKDLFLTPLDENRKWFRYHPLFADFLQEELDRRYPEEISRLHRGAAKWYLSQGFPEIAFRHAVDGEDFQGVSQIFERYLIVKLLGGEIKIVQDWLAALPETWQEKYPGIALAQAGILLVTGQFEACARRLDRVEQLALATEENVEFHQARVTAMRCNIACFQNDMARAEAFARQALQILSENDLDFRAGIYGALGDTYRRNGRWEEAKESYLKLLGYAEVPTFRVQSVHVYGALADLELRQGHLQNAASYWNKALTAIQQRANRGNFPLPLIGWVYIRLAELHYEWNELGEARQHLAEGLKRAELGGDVRSLIAGYLLSARLKLTEGDFEQTSVYLEQARPQIESAQFAHWTSRFERLQLDIWLSQNELEKAIDWADSKLKNASLENPLGDELDQLALTRLLLAKGDREALISAQELLDDVLPKVKDEGRAGLHIEALVLQSLLHWKRGDKPRVMTALEHALRLAKPEGYVRLFADLGISMGRLLQEARSRQVMIDYVDKLLGAFGEGIPAPKKSVLPEPLTEREIDVLGLMAAGLTNPEIAEKLVVSAGTVKKHASHIYKKLGVHSRTEAASKARELDLLNH